MTVRNECTQSVNGILLVNKPQGLSSNAVLQKVKRLYKAKKAGHTGSLDPLATGMLPVCFGEATKFCQYLLDADKSYQATGLLGIKTTTADSMGDVIAQTQDFHVSKDQLQAVIDQFIGTILQIPSMFSALKHQGTPLYRLARQGISIERPAREIVIHGISLLSFDDNQFTINVSCTKGTYIRNLVEDIGDKLGVYAHVTQLHRHYTAGLAHEIMYSLEQLNDTDPTALTHLLLPPERAVNYLPELIINDEKYLQLKQGKLIEHGNPEIKVELIRLYNTDKQFLGLGEIIETGQLKVKRLLAC